MVEFRWTTCVIDCPQGVYYLCFILIYLWVCTYKFRSLPVNGFIYFIGKVLKNDLCQPAKFGINKEKQVVNFYLTLWRIKSGIRPRLLAAPTPPPPPPLNYATAPDDNVPLTSIPTEYDFLRNKKKTNLQSVGLFSNTKKEAGYKIQSTL